jgi:hypothetical protein
MITGTLVKRHLAIENLEQIVTRDPLYKPAYFFLAYAKLLDGEIHKAADMFSVITAPTHQEGERIRKSVKEQWPKFGLRYARLVGAIKPLKQFLLPWMKLWQGITINLQSGGILNEQSELWSRFQEEMTKGQMAKERGDKLGINLFRVYINTFTEKYGIRKYVNIAAGLESGDLSPEDARGLLDNVLDEYKIQVFDGELNWLESRLSSLVFNKSLNENIKKYHLDMKLHKEKNYLPNIRELRESKLGIVFKKELEQLEIDWEAEDWEHCKKILENIRDEIRRPSEYEAETLLLRALRLPKRTGWLIRFFLPDYSLLDRWRTPFQRAFFLESEYYYELAKYRTFERKEWIEASKRAFTLHDQHLSGPTPTDMDARRHIELRLLARCLEADSAVRAELDLDEGEFPSTREIAIRFRASILARELHEDLIKNATDSDMDSIVRAAAYTSLGLLERYQRAKQRLLSIDHPIEKELSYYRQALELRRDPDTCFAMAECLLDLGQQVDAQHFIEEALRLSPGHVGALTLSKKIDRLNK